MPFDVLEHSNYYYHCQFNALMKEMMVRSADQMVSDGFRWFRMVHSNRTRTVSDQLANFGGRNGNLSLKMEST